MDNYFKEVILCICFVSWLFFIVLCSIVVHVKGLQSEKAQSPCQRYSLLYVYSPTRAMFTSCSGVVLEKLLRPWITLPKSA